MSGASQPDAVSIVVTGASGFVGRALCKRLGEEGLPIRGVSRHWVDFAAPGIDWSSIDIGPDTNWSGLLAGSDGIVHLAARVHVMHDIASNPLTEFMRINVDGTLNLARQAVTAGVKRFVFVSSVKVNGEETLPGKPFSAGDVPAPVDPYGISKFEAERGLLQLAAETGLEVVIVRPPLVYGPGVKANFEKMVRWLAKGIPLPLGGVHGNRRSLVALDNLVDLLTVCLRHPAAAGHVFMVSDGEDLSTTDLLRRLGQAMHRPASLMPVSPALLEFGGRLLGQEDVVRRLTGSLQVDIEKTRQVLGWEPPVTVDEGLRRVCTGAGG